MIGYAYVCADLIHIGHLRFLENCKIYCDELTVGVLTDEAVMEKKPKPIIPFQQRIEMVEALKVVDSVITQETYSPLPNVEMLRPDVLFESDSHTKEAIAEAEKIKEVIVIPYYKEQSSTKIKEKINELT